MIKKDGVNVARAIIGKNNDGSLVFAGNINEGEIIQIALGNIDEILKKVRKYKKIYLYYPKKKKLLKEFKNKIKTIHASGGIVNNKKNQILFILRRGKWDLPKGKAEIGETKRQTALREVKEETGVKELVINGFFKTTFHLVRNNGKYFLKETNRY